MLKFIVVTVAPCVALLALTGCSTQKTQITSLSPTPTPSLSTVTQSSPIIPAAPSPSLQINPFQDASDKAIGAATVSKSAQSKDDWDLVAATWQDAIALMKAVPQSSSNYVLSQKKVVEYQRNLAYAKQQVVRIAVPPVDLAVATEESVPNNAAVADPIIQNSSASTTATSPRAAESDYEKFIRKEREAKASVSKFMDDYFEDVVNKGQSGLTSWCAASFDFASSLYSPESWQVLDISAYPDAGIASITARIESSNGGGNPIRQNWKFSLKKGNTYLEQRLLKEGATDTYKYSKSQSGGWCIHLMSES